MNQCITDEIIGELTLDQVSLNFDDLVFIEQYLQKKLETGRNNMTSIRSILFKMFKFFKTTSISEINRLMMIQYFDYLTEKGLSHSTKQTAKDIIISFFRYYKNIFEETNPNYIIPVPPTNVYQFKKKIKTTEETIKDIEESSYTDNQLIKIINYTYKLAKSGTQKTTRSFFYVIIIMMFTGMRISECNTIKKKNLHLSENYLVTGFEENARKNKKPLYFCFPKEIALLLQEFLLDDNGSEWVFRGRIKNKNTYLTVASIMILCERMSKELGFKILSHSFRRTLITRLLHESKCPTHIVETITNHEISAIIFKNYDQYSIELRKKDYFEYLPQSYKKILDYLSNL